MADVRPLLIVPVSEKELKDLEFYQQVMMEFAGEDRGTITGPDVEFALIEISRIIGKHYREWTLEERALIVEFVDGHKTIEID